MPTTPGEPAPGLRFTDPEDLRVLVAALHAFSHDVDQQASDEAGWRECDVPAAHVALLREWAARAGRLCEQAEQALARVPQPAVR